MQAKADRASAAVLRDRIAQLHQLIEVAAGPGNGDANGYLHGMANGMIFAYSVMVGEEPDYLEVDRYLEDIELLDKLKDAGVLLNSEK